MEKKQTLSDDFIVPPYSVFDTRMGYWKERKRKWKEWLGQTNETREGALYDNLEMKLPKLYQASMEFRKKKRITFEEYVRHYVPQDRHESMSSVDASAGASSFDPVLAEIACRWFTPQEGSAVFDCFAGGVTKGAVACRCGHTFFGIDIRGEQVSTNKKKSEALGVSPIYVEDDGCNVGKYLGIGTQDLLLSCPPYFNLEVYSNLESDLSNQRDYGTFLGKLEAAYSSAIRSLKRNRFAVIVVGDIRDKSGGCHNFPGDVIDIFQRNGCVLWNDIVVIGNDAHAKLRARQYMTSRKVVRSHQRMLVFYYGKPSAISKNFDKLKELNTLP